MQMGKYPFLVRIASIIAFSYLFFSCGTSTGQSNKNDGTTEQGKSIMVFAGASLTDVLSEIIDSFEVKYNAEVKTNMASSGTLARQIEQGGSPDVYISASKKWANYVDSSGFILKGHKAEIAQNDLVLIAPQGYDIKIPAIDSSLIFPSLLGSGRLSIGDPSHVPAGKYAKQSLEYFGWYDQLDKKTLPAKDVRSALMVVEMGEAPLGIVYRTDALKSKKVRILNTFPEKSHKPIVYVAGVCRDNKLAKDFFVYLNSDETKDIWIKYGFKK
jgi:molybdate transport system substrate-binding protein